jgi:hypothetical protein
MFNLISQLAQLIKSVDENNLQNAFMGGLDISERLEKCDRLEQAQLEYNSTKNKYDYMYRIYNK